VGDADQTGLLETLHGLANRVAVDAKLLGQQTLGGQGLARGRLAREDLLAEGRVDRVRKRLGAF